MLIDNRQFPRAVIPCKLSIFLGERILVFTSHTQNLGVGGIKITLETKLQISTVVELELLLPDREKPIECIGQVVWAKEINPSEIKPHLFSIGIRFMDIAGSAQEEIRKFVNTLN